MMRANVGESIFFLGSYSCLCNEDYFLISSILLKNVKNKMNILKLKKVNKTFNNLSDWNDAFRFFFSYFLLFSSTLQDLKDI